MKNVKIADAFLEAKAFLWDGFHDQRTGVTPYICISLYIAYKDNRISYNAYSAAVNVITDRLNGQVSITLEDWLHERGCIPSRYVIPRALRQKIQAYRRAWMDELIKEFS